jgi:hypothetical protein
MASTSFRDSINSLGWSRRDDVPVNTSQQSGLLTSLSSLNPFSDRGYVQLPTTEGAGAPLPAPSRREEEESWFVRESSYSLPCDISMFSPCHSANFPSHLFSVPCSKRLRLAMCPPCLARVLGTCTWASIPWFRCLSSYSPYQLSLGCQMTYCRMED